MSDKKTNKPTDQKNKNQKETPEVKETKSTDKIGKLETTNLNEYVPKKASELTDSEKKKLQHTKIKIEKKVSRRTKNVFYDVKIRFDTDSEDDKPIYIPYKPVRGKTPFGENHWKLIVAELGLDPKKSIHVLNVPIRLFKGTSVDPETEEEHEYTRYQCLISDHVIIGGFLQFHEIVLINKQAKKYDFIQANNLNFDSTDDSDF